MDSHYGRGRDFSGHFKHIKKFPKNFFKKCEICIILAYFSKNLRNHELIFRAWTINANCCEILRKFGKLDANSIEKLIFFNFYFGKFVTKNRAFGNNTIFYNNFFCSGGGRNFPLPHGYALDSHYLMMQHHYLIMNVFKETNQKFKAYFY